MRLNYSEEREYFEDFREHSIEQSRIIDDNFRELAYQRRMKSLAPVVARESERNTTDYVEQNYQRIMLERGFNEQQARREAETQYIWSN